MILCRLSTRLSLFGGTVWFELALWDVVLFSVENLFSLDEEVEPTLEATGET